MSFLPMKKKTIDNNTINTTTTWSSSKILDMIYPIGSIYISTNSANPSTYLTGTSWEAFATGKTLVGIDANDTSFDTVEETGGEKEHTLTVDEIPSHNHTYSNSVVTGNFKWWGAAGTNYGDTHSSTNTGDTGGGQAHNNLQPYIVLYMWKRIA